MQSGQFRLSRFLYLNQEKNIDKYLTSKEKMNTIFEKRSGINMDSGRRI